MTEVFHYFHKTLHTNFWIVPQITSRQPHYTPLPSDSLNNPIILYLWLYTPFLDLGRFLSFLILYTVGRAAWTGYEPLARPVRTHKSLKSQNKFTQTSMPRVKFEPTVPLFELAKMVHALDRAATLIGSAPCHHMLHSLKYRHVVK
jgi:hypothetical protein